MVSPSLKIKSSIARSLLWSIRFFFFLSFSFLFGLLFCICKVLLTIQSTSVPYISFQFHNNTIAIMQAEQPLLPTTAGQGKSVVSKEPSVTYQDHTQQVSSRKWRRTPRLPGLTECLPLLELAAPHSEEYFYVLPADEKAMMLWNFIIAVYKPLGPSAFKSCPGS